MNVVGNYAIPRLDLGVAMWEFLREQDAYIGTKVLPVFPTALKTAAFSKIARESITRRRAVDRATRSAYNRDTFDVKDQTYACQEYGHEQPLDDSERAFYAIDLNAEITAAKMAMEVILREQEIRIAAKVFDTTKWTGASLTAAVGTIWSNAGGSAIDDVRNAKEQVRKNCGLLANTLVINKTVLGYLLQMTNIVGRVQYAEVATRQAVLEALARILDIDQILVGLGIYNSAAETAAFVSNDIWSKSNAMVCYVPKTQNLAEPGIGRTFLWSSDSPDNTTVEQYREEQTRSWIYRCRHFVDEKIFDANFGFLITGCA